MRVRPGLFGIAVQAQIAVGAENDVAAVETITPHDKIRLIQRVLPDETRGRTRAASSISSNAIQEFQVGKSNFLAEFGRAAGGSINTVVRSGGNDFHADGFYYFRNAGFNAMDPYIKSTNPIKPDETRQQFGGSIGGAAKKNKLFYFVNL